MISNLKARYYDYTMLIITIPEEAKPVVLALAIILGYFVIAYVVRLIKYIGNMRVKHLIKYIVIAIILKYAQNIYGSMGHIF